MIDGIASEAFILEHPFLLRDVSALCGDQGLRSALVATMPTVNDNVLAICQLGGDPHRGVHKPGLLSEGPHLGRAAPAWPSALWTRGRGSLAAAPSLALLASPVERDGVGCVVAMGPLSPNLLLAPILLAALIPQPNVREP